jgi:hypothetical protein
MRLLFVADVVLCKPCLEVKILVVQTVQMLGVLCKSCVEVKMLGVQTVQMLGGADDICADSVGAV